MKKILIILLFISGFIVAQTDFNVKQATVTIVAGDSTVNIDMYELMGDKVGEVLKPFYFMTDTAMTSTSLIIKIYDEKNSLTYKTFAEYDNTNYTYTISANKTYPFLPMFFGALDKFQIELDSPEAYDRVLTIGARVY